MYERHEGSRVRNEACDSQYPLILCKAYPYSSLTTGTSLLSLSASPKIISKLPSTAPTATLSLCTPVVLIPVPVFRNASQLAEFSARATTSGGDPQLADDHPVPTE